VAINAEVTRRSFDLASGKSALHMVNARACEQPRVLAQIATDAKSHEIIAVPRLLELRSLKGTIVASDAPSCQRAIAQQILGQACPCEGAGWRLCSGAEGQPGRAA